MFKAHINGQDISEKEYIEKEHKGKMQCPCETCRNDEDYNPEMRFRHGAHIVDAGSEAPRRDHFFTHGDKKHHPDCDASRHEYTYRATAKALKDGGFTLFNLDITEKLSQTFNRHTGIKRLGDLEHHEDWKKHHRNNYRAIPLHDTETIVTVLKHIKEDLGEEALKRCFFHSGDFVASHETFDLRNQPEKLGTLFRSMASKLDGAVVGDPLKNDRGEEWVFGFPRLTSITNIHPHYSHSAQGSEQIIQTQKGRQRLTHIIKPKDTDRRNTRKELLDNAEISMIATPHIELKSEWNARQRNSMHFMCWSIHSKSQTMITQLPEPVETDTSSQQRQWKFAQG